MASPFEAWSTADWTVRSGAERVPAALSSPDGATNQVLVSAPEPGPEESGPSAGFRPSATSPPSETVAPAGMTTASTTFAGAAEPGPIDRARARIAGGASNNLRRFGDARADDTSM